jgi:hypothetical protein
VVVQRMVIVTILRALTLDRKTGMKLMHGAIKERDKSPTRLGMPQFFSYTSS